MPFPNSLARCGPSRFLPLVAYGMLAACGTPDRPQGAGRGRVVSDVPVKIGAPYSVGGRQYVPADDRRYDRTGNASWYGGQHRGRTTANGERFDPNGISAAHTTLPLPSYAEVTALDTGRTIVVRINDRGPFVAGRIIDLSQGAARLLGVERSGVARVRVRRVEPNERDRAALRAGRPASGRAATTRQALASIGPGTGIPAIVQPLAPRPLPRPPALTKPTPSYASGLSFVEIAALDDADRADALASSVGALGPAAAVPIGAGWHVRIGPYSGDAATRSALARAVQAGYQDARVVRESAP